MGPETPLKYQKFYKLIGWFGSCEQQPDDFFTQLANTLDITPRTLIQILSISLRTGKLEIYLLADVLEMSQQHAYVRTINELLQPDRILHQGVTQRLHPGKWMCFMQMLHDFVHDDTKFNFDYQNYVSCVSRMSEESQEPNRGVVVGEMDGLEGADIGLGIPLSPTEKQIKINAKNTAKQQIHELISQMLRFTPSTYSLMPYDTVLHEMITRSIAQMRHMITVYLKNKTINKNVVCNLYHYYAEMFFRTDERIENDRHWIDNPTPAQQGKSKIRSSILDALRDLCGIEKGGGKKSRYKKRTRAIKYRHKKSVKVYRNSRKRNRR